MVFVISFQFLSILVTYLSFGTEKLMYYQVFSLKQINCPLNSSASSFIFIFFSSSINLTIQYKVCKTL